MKSKAREFWINKYPGTRVHSAVDYVAHSFSEKAKAEASHDKLECIHVIEYSEVERLQKQLEIAKVALKFYANPNFETNKGNNAREALNEINQLNEKE